MFRKLTTIVDCKLAREIEKDFESEICSSEGFKVCMELASQVVYPALNHTIQRQVLNTKGFEASERFPDGNGKTLLQFVGGGGYDLRRLLEESHRIEAVIQQSKMKDFSFDWLLLLFKKSEKEAFYSVSIHVTLEGQISRPHLMNWR